MIQEFSRAESPPAKFGTLSTLSDGLAVEGLVKTGKKHLKLKIHANISKD